MQHQMLIGMDVDKSDFELIWRENIYRVIGKGANVTLNV